MLPIDPHPTSRRDFLRCTLASAAAAATAPVASAAGSSRKLRFAVVTDIHYRDARCGEWLHRVVGQIRASRPRPDFVVLAGDLSDLGTAEQLGAVRDHFRTLPMPVHTIIGNHDYTVDGSRRVYEELHGKPLNYRFAAADYEFLVLDSTQGRSVYRTHIPTETLTWLDRQLPSISREKPVVVLTHFPLGRNWLRPMNASAVLQRLKPYAVQGAFSGHWHGLTERQENDLHLSTGRCCSWWRTNHDGSDLKGYTLCEATTTGVTHRFVPVPMAAV